MSADFSPTLRIAFLTPSWPVSAGANGIVTSIHNIRPGLEAAGCRVSLLAQTSGASMNEPNVADLGRGTFLTPLERLIGRALGRVSRLSANDFRLTRSILRAVASQRTPPQLLEIEESFGYAASLSRKIPCPIVVRLHGPYFMTGLARGDPFTSEYRTRVQREGRGIKAASGVSAPSRITLQQAIDFYSYSPPIRAVIPNAQPILPAGSRWTAASSDRRTILFVGRLDRLKGVDLALRAFAALSERYPDSRLVLVGPDGGFSAGGNRRLGISELISELIPSGRIRKRITVLGYLPPQAVIELRKTCLVSLVCSRYETFGYTALESMAQGCPVIASKTDGLAEVVTDEHSGLLFESENVDALATQISRILDDEVLASRLSEAALADCADRYDPTSIGRQTKDFYMRVLEGNSD